MFRLPKTDEHVSIIGQNGSGKTQLAAWLVAMSNYDTFPTVIIDYKRERLFSHIEHAQLLGTFRGRPPWNPPKKPGIYLLQPEPWEEDPIEDFLYKVWRRGKTRLYFDEAHMIPKQNGGAFQAILTQGRSKRIPCVILTQRPSWASRFIFSEAKFFSVFHLNDERDRKTVESFVPVDLSQQLPKFHSYWHDTSENKTNVLTPVPSANTIIEQFNSKLPKPRRWFGNSL